MKMLLTASLAVSSGIVQAQDVPTVLKSVSAVTELPTVALNDKVPDRQFSLVRDLVSFARRHLSIRYRSGGTTKRGFDCSGFTRFCFSQFGIALPHSSAAQGNVGRAVDQTDAQPGDLILFKGHNSGGSRIGHVGLITEVIGSRVRFIHAAWNGGVRHDYLHASYYRHRFMGIRRVVPMLAGK